MRRELENRSRNWKAKDVSQVHEIKSPDRFCVSGSVFVLLELDGCSQSDLGLAFALKQSSDGAIPKRCGLHSKADPEGGLTFL